MNKPFVLNPHQIHNGEPCMHASFSGFAEDNINFPMPVSTVLPRGMGFARFVWATFFDVVRVFHDAQFLARN